VLSVLATTWYIGRRRLAIALAENSVPVEQFLNEMHEHESLRIDGTAVFLTGNPEDIPYILRHQWLKLRTVHERIVLLTISPANEPYIDERKRVTVERLAENLVRVHAGFGFMELPNLQPIVDSCAASGLHIGGDDTLFFVAAPQIVKGGEHHMWPVQRWLFKTMYRLAGTMVQDIHIPSAQLVALGIDVPV